ncbi:ADP-ribosylglycohydrolase family protein [Loigolactobacillus rennini]|uniref:ADP-ribosylglycohydrolase n=1 Tax=Loigolactobacillus rennini DSM 20253 TaxID=1423796 RepID=A0A0R2D3P0_9LACO|nr:ADP-ribosylglycohydrolase family protein [Loigolactobacillus rennini]KRM98750.1 ADP-ribosylglycohydrolase [Loigolactobacillus rennini DSM 20253]
MQDKKRILGTIYGQAIGDSMGMPTELWPVQQIQQKFGNKVTTFLDGTSDNEIAANFTKGEYTDDTNQALAIIEALIESDWKPNKKIIVKHILDWANKAGAWTNNILGPSSKAALKAIRAGQDPNEITKTALTNGCGMRIAPIGALFEPAQLNELVKMVYEVTRITHSSDVAISGACLIAGAVTAGTANYNWDEIVHYAITASDTGFSLGAPTWAAKVKDRTKLGIKLAQEYRYDEHEFSKAVYDLIGTGTMISESIPAALTIAYYTRSVKHCAILCTNLGGDTDTIGAMATAICGAKEGVDAIPTDWVKLINKKNPQHNIEKIAEKMMTFRQNN